MVIRAIVFSLLCLFHHSRHLDGEFLSGNNIAVNRKVCVIVIRWHYESRGIITGSFHCTVIHHILRFYTHQNSEMHLR